MENEIGFSDDTDLPTPSGTSPSSTGKEGSPTQKPYQLLAKNQFPDTCAVCRNPSIGYNYTVRMFWLWSQKLQNPGPIM